jgi:hypothetical protein
METFIINIFHRIKNFFRISRSLYKELEKPRVIDYIPNEYSYLQSGSFLHENIVANINKTMKYVFKTIYIFDNVEVDINIIYDHFDEQRNNYLIFIVNLVIYILNMYESTPRKLRLLLIHCPLKKTKPENKGILTSDNVNTGVTMMNSATNGDIIVYRSEEMTKVLIHELIHFYNFDRKNIGSNVEKDLNMYFKIVGKTINVNESFTDTLACLFNIVIYTAFKNPNTINDHDFYKLFIKNFEEEKAFILGQAVNVLDYIGYNTSNPGIIKINKPNNEQTHVISYYVLKAANFNNISSFINFIIQYKYYLENPIEYIEMLKTNIKLLTKNVKFYTSTKHLSSLRMTSLDIDLLHKVKLLKDKTKK